MILFRGKCGQSCLFPFTASEAAAVGLGLRYAILTLWSREKNCRFTAFGRCRTRLSGLFRTCYYSFQTKAAFNRNLYSNLVFSRHIGNIYFLFAIHYCLEFGVIEEPCHFLDRAIDVLTVGASRFAFRTATEVPGRPDVSLEFRRRPCRRDFGPIVEQFVAPRKADRNPEVIVGIPRLRWLNVGVMNDQNEESFRWDGASGWM